jgi:hypothetical protein
MGIATGLLLIAVGAILDFAVDVQTKGFNLHTIGLILMIVGALGAVISIFFWSSWGGFHSRSVIVEGAPRRRRTVQDEII